MLDYLEWPEQQIQLPGFDVQRQAADKQGPHLEKEAKRHLSRKGEQHAKSAQKYPSLMTAPHCRCQQLAGLDKSPST